MHTRGAQQSWAHGRKTSACSFWSRVATDYINTTSVTVNGLAEYTTYFFQVYAGDNAGYDVNFFTPPPSAQTLINRMRVKPPEPDALVARVRELAHT